MKEPYYFADEKELFAKIFEMSDELTKRLTMDRPDTDVPPKRRKPKRDSGAANSDPNNGQTLPLFN